MTNPFGAVPRRREHRPSIRSFTSNASTPRALSAVAWLGLVACAGQTNDEAAPESTSARLRQIDPIEIDLPALDRPIQPPIPTLPRPSLTLEENPAFSAKLRDPKRYRVLRSDQEDICPGTGALQHVRSYDGTLGQPVAFVNAHRMPVGAMESEPAAGEPPKYCSGTLIARDLFLTASHCVDSNTIGNDAVSFNYERLAGSTVLDAESHFDITAIVEDGADDGLDYAILRLAGSPADAFGVTAVERFMPPIDHLLTIIQHPSGEAKQVEVGHLHSLGDEVVRYDDLDTEGGSSGSGILDKDGSIIGVHTNGGCERGEQNFGTRIDRIAAVSETISGLLGPTILARTGTLSLLRVHDVGTGYGPPGDAIDAEVIVQLTGDTKYAYGFRLRADTDEDARAGMLRALRDAFRKNQSVRIEFERNTYSTNEVFRVIRQ